jgi:hypothetical protein
MFIFLVLACAHTQATWEFTPRPVVDSPMTSVAVVASDRRCQPVADALARDLAMRNGVTVEPNASTRLLLNMCRVDVRTEIDLSQLYPGMGAGTSGMLEHREEAIRGKGTAVMTVEIGNEPVVMLHSEGHRVRVVREDDPSNLQRRTVIHNSVISDIAEDLAQQLVPTSETIRRRWYRNAEPGTSKALHNRAVDAERSGDMSEALRLATEAVNANRTPGSVAYLRSLEERQNKQVFVEK